MLLFQLFDKKINFHSLQIEKLSSSKRQTTIDTKFQINHLYKTKQKHMKLYNDTTLHNERVNYPTNISFTYVRRIFRFFKLL